MNKFLASQPSNLILVLLYFLCVHVHNIVLVRSVPIGTFWFSPKIHKFLCLFIWKKKRSKTRFMHFERKFEWLLWMCLLCWRWWWLMVLLFSSGIISFYPRTSIEFGSIIRVNKVLNEYHILINGLIAVASLRKNQVKIDIHSFIHSITVLFYTYTNTNLFECNFHLHFAQSWIDDITFCIFFYIYKFIQRLFPLQMG